jgi:hypothetical protein
MDRESVLDIALACAVACTSTNPSPGLWKNLLATYTNVLFEGILNRLPKDQFVPVKISTEQVALLRSEFIRLDTEADALPDDNATGLPAGAFSGFVLPWDLPSPDASAVAGWTTYCRDEKVLYAHYALLIFLAGKQINDKNREAITVARPRALIQKFKIEATAILSGPMRISNHAHAAINQAWLEMSSLKAQCFREFSTYSHSSTTLGQDILLTNVNLMRFAQMQHATMIHKFLLAYPWASEMSALRQAISIYHDSLTAALKIQDHLQPFIKVIWGDKSGIFPRKELGPLIAVALDTEKEVHETLANYYSDERFVSVVEAFREERARRAILLNRGVPAPVHLESIDALTDVDEDEEEVAGQSDNDAEDLMVE